MNQPVFALKYMTRFRCMADRCEDTCCAGMQIPLTAMDERRLTQALGAAARQHLTALETPVHGCSSVLSRTDEGACRLLDANRLCSLVVRAGDEALSDACAMFPRTVTQTPERVEVAGSLACPEAARLCLLSEDGAELVAASPALLTRFSPSTSPREREPYEALAELVRDAATSVLRDRRRPIRERLLRLAGLGARTESFFFRGGTEDVRERLMIELARTEPSLDVPERGEVVIQMLFSLVTGLHGRGTARFQQLLQVVTHTYQAAALELAPSLGQTPQPTLLWATLWRALRAKRERADRVIGPRLELLLERYWLNDLHRAPFTRSRTLSSHAFQMILRGAVLRFLVLGHPAIDHLASNDRALTADEEREFDAAFIETVQLYAKHIEKDSEMFAMLEAHFSLESLKTNALGRAGIFAHAA